MPGCRVEPLGSYLKALGVLRLVAEQLDPDVTARWDRDSFVLACSADRKRILEFFLADYRPTPVMAPWNGRTITAFGDPGRSRNAVRDLERSTDERLAELRHTVAATRKVYARGAALGLEPKQDKAMWVRLCRSLYPDTAIPWLDAVVVLTTDKPAYPLVTGGTGGVLGSGDLSLNYLEQVHRLVTRRSVADAELLEAALFASGSPRLSTALVGQFDPGAAGGQGVGRSAVNPWDLVLMIEGALLFAGGAVRRLGFAATGRTAMPFTVRGTPTGFGSAAHGEDVKGEVWAPLWAAPAHLNEIRALLAEGRATWSGRQARTALDFARAAGSMGVDDGIDQFVRHSIGARLGQSNLAVPVGRIHVRHRPGTAALRQLDPWLNAIRALADRPAPVDHGLLAVEKALFEAATTGRPDSFLSLLGSIAELDRTVARSRLTRRKVPPITDLVSTDWIPLLDDGTVEFSIACAIASARMDRYGPSHIRMTAEAVVTDGKRRLRYSESPPIVTGLGVRRLVEFLAIWAAQRSTQALAVTEPVPGQPGVTLGFPFSSRVSERTARMFFGGTVDEARIERTLLALGWLWWHPAPKALRRPTSAVRPIPTPPAFSVIAPFGQHRQVQYRGSGGVLLRSDPRWPAMLLARRNQEVLDQALQRLATARLRPFPISAEAVARNTDPLRLAAALVIPIRRKGAAALLGDVLASDDHR